MPVLGGPSETGLAQRASKARERKFLPLLARPCRVLVFSKEDEIVGFVGATEDPRGRAQWQAQSSTHRFLHET
jgi:hypothetical protein